MHDDGIWIDTNKKKRNPERRKIEELNVRKVLLN